MHFELTAALRSLARAKGHTAAIVLILALGLGSATAVFSVVEGVLFPTTDIPESATLVRIDLASSVAGSTTRPRREHLVTYRDAAPSSFLGFAGAFSEWANFQQDADVRPVSALRVTVNFLDLLGVSPMLGRGFVREDQTAAGVQPIVLSEHFWRTQFGANPDALGRIVYFDDKPCVIIGVLPRLRLPPQATGQFYAPYQSADFSPADSNIRKDLTLYARLKTGAPLAAAQAELRALPPHSGLPPQKYWDKFSPLVVPHDASPPLDPLLRQKNWALLGAVGLLYFIACVNATNLMLVRTLDRKREFGVRCALGGSRWRVVRPVLLEGLLLAVISTLLGIAAAKWLLSLLLALTPEAGAPLALSARCLAVLAVLGGFSALMLAFVPYGQASRLDIHSALKSADPAGGMAAGFSLRHIFVIIQTALAVALLVSTGLLMRTCRQLLEYDVGFAPEGKILVRVDTPSLTSGDRASLQAKRETLRQLVEGVSALPGVRSVTTVTGSVFTVGINSGYRIHGTDENAYGLMLNASFVGEEYFWFLAIFDG